MKEALLPPSVRSTGSGEEDAEKEMQLLRRGTAGEVEEGRTAWRLLSCYGLAAAQRRRRGMGRAAPNQTSTAAVRLALGDVNQQRGHGAAVFGRHHGGGFIGA